MFTTCLCEGHSRISTHYEKNRTVSFFSAKLGTWWKHFISYVTKHHVVFGQPRAYFLTFLLCRPFVNYVTFPVCPDRHVWCSHLNLSCCINLWECYLWKWQHINYKTNSDISRPLCGLGVQLSSLRFSLWKRFRLRELAPIVANLDSTIHRINHYPVDKVSKFWITHGVKAFSDERGKISTQAHTLICIHL